MRGLDFYPRVALSPIRSRSFHQSFGALRLPPRIPEPVLQPIGRDAQPVSESQPIYKERRAEDAVLNVAPAGDGERRS
jgi:hypothetical protein